MNQKEASSIIDSMIERTRLGAQDLGPGAIELYKLLKALRMNIHEMKKEVYAIISEEGEIKEKVFFEILCFAESALSTIPKTHKRITERSCKGSY